MRPATRARQQPCPSRSTRPARASRSPIRAPVVGGTISLTRPPAVARHASSSRSPRPAAATWTQIANDTSAPFSTPFDTSTLPEASTTSAPSATTRRQRLRARAPDKRPLRQHGPDPHLVDARRRHGVDVRQPDRADRQRAVTAPGALLDGIAAPDRPSRARRSPSRPARWRTACSPVRRARGRQRHPLAVPRRGLDPEHADDLIRRRWSAASPPRATSR